VIATANHAASDWAQERAAQMVGMSYDDAGTLIPNPNVEWARRESSVRRGRP
jgi:hypothetical protein